MPFSVVKILMSVKSQWTPLLTRRGMEMELLRNSKR